MGAYKSTYTSKEIQKKLDKIDIYNFIGKFSDDSTENDWYCSINGKVVNLNVNPETKEFNENIDLMVSDKINSFHRIFSESKIEKITKFQSGTGTTNMGYMFPSCKNLAYADLSLLDTSSATTISCLFSHCNLLTSIDLSNFDTSNVIVTSYAFDTCSNLESLYLDNFDMSKVTKSTSMFLNCKKLSYIKCKQAFKYWCIQNQEEIDLPEAMREGGSGTWDIVDAV